MQKSITRLMLVACASLSVASLQAMEGSKAEALRQKVQAAKADKIEQSNVEQLKEHASQDAAAQESAIAAFVEQNPGWTRAGAYTLLAISYSVGGPYTILASIIAMEVVARTKQSATVDEQDQNASTPKAVEVK